MPNAKLQFSIPSNLMPATKNNTGTWGVNTSDYIFPFCYEWSGENFIIQELLMHLRINS